MWKKLLLIKWNFGGNFEIPLLERDILKNK